MNLEQRIQLLEERLAKQSPYRQFEYVEVTFPSTAHQDLVVSHTLTPTTPDHIVYRVERSNLPVRVYHDETPDRKSWGRGFIVLRADQANVKVRLLVAVPEDDRVFKADPQELPLAPTGMEVHALDGEFHSGSLPWASVDKTGALPGDVGAAASSHGHAHGDLTGVGANDHHAQQHQLDGADHLGTLAWTKVDKTGALPGDVGAAAVSHSHLFDQVYPVGSIYISVVATNPATLFGFGTWEAFATGRTLVGIDSAQAEFDTVEETGGAKTHALTATEMPSHNHPGSTVAISDPGHAHKVVYENWGVTNGGNGPVSKLSGGGVNDATESGYTGISATAKIAAQGGGAAHNNLQPYVVVFMWKRTA